MDLVLNLKKKYFLDIKAGIKKEEFRLCNSYWEKRILNKNFKNVIIKLGYPSNSEKNKILVFPWQGYAIKEIKHEEWDFISKKVFAIKLVK